tara:strand:- start:66 stop:1118 length:1053 start_codon:yes stop_codon:yes gene_type:complete
MAAFTTIDDAGSFFSPTLYTGNTSTQTITGVGFSADFTWIKDRDATKWHSLVDTARGYNKWVYSNDSAVEDTVTDRLTSWNSDGFALGANLETNTDTNDYVSWNWKAGTTTGIDTTGSTITPSAYTFNQTSRFSAIAYTGNATAGAKLPHGLGTTPIMIIVKNLQTTESWMVYHQYSDAVPEDYAMQLNTTGPNADNNTNWNDTAPDSVNITFGDGAGTNSANNFIAYCFADVQGYSKMGSYLANGNADGPFVYTGFRPAFVMTKATTGYINWNMFDSKRPPYNPEEPLWANTTGTEASIGAYDVDLLSNGFKARTLSSQVNSTSTPLYIFAAFAESPFVNSNGVPSNAR